MISFPGCITWLVVGLTECIVIVTINIITIIVFVKNRNLLKRSTYLVINLAVVDMLVGGSATWDLFYWVGPYCNLWNYNSSESLEYALLTLLNVFSYSSITNITIISLERLHATLRPFGHRVIKKIVYRLLIAVVWVIGALLSIAATVVMKFKDVSYYFHLLNSFNAICLLVICFSYACIFIKVRCGAQPRHHGAASRERKLTMTLLMVTIVSLLLFLPFIIFMFFIFISETFISMSGSVFFHSVNALKVLYYANSVVNPILYAIRMPEYRSALTAFFRGRPQQPRQVALGNL